MASRLEEEFARRALARKLRGTAADPDSMKGILGHSAWQDEDKQHEPDAPPPHGSELHLDVGEPQEEKPQYKLEVGTPRITTVDVDNITAEEAPSKGEMMMADAKNQKLSTSQRRRMRRKKLEEALAKGGRT